MRGSETHAISVAANQLMRRGFRTSPVTRWLVLSNFSTVQLGADTQQPRALLRLFAYELSVTVCRGAGLRAIDVPAISRSRAPPPPTPA
jgi:hypothetical protein